MCIQSFHQKNLVGIMNYYIAIFKSRSSAVNFSNLLRMRNIPCAIVNTPTSIKQSCGLSVKFLGDYFLAVNEIIALNPSLNFDSFYFVEDTWNGQKVRRL